MLSVLPVVAMQIGGERGAEVRGEGLLRRLGSPRPGEESSIAPPRKPTKNTSQRARGLPRSRAAF
eukprot:8264228-Pyramimonas_sp.AAC.1